jgi:hypothetical protein
MNKYLKTKEGSIEDLAKQMQNKVLESDYQDKFKKELDKAGKPLGQMTGAEKKAFFNKIDKMHKGKNEAVDNPYAVGMAAAMKAKNDQPPLKKSTITKAHDIAKSIAKDDKKEEVEEEAVAVYTDKNTRQVKSKKFKDETEAKNWFRKNNVAAGQIMFKPASLLKKEDYTKKDVDKFHTKLDKLVHKSFGHSSDEKKKEMKEARWEIEGRVSYKGISSEDSFHMVIDAPSKDAAERKAYNELDKARQRKKIGPGGGGSIDDADIESIEKTNDKLSPPESGPMMNSYDPTQKEEVHPHVKKMVKDGESDTKIKKMHPELKDDELEKLKETHMSTAKSQNQKQREVGGEKEPIKTSKNEWKTFAMMAAELRENNKADKGKKEQEAGEDTRDSKQKTMTGQVATSPEMNPKVDYKY